METKIRSSSTIETPYGLHSIVIPAKEGIQSTHSSSRGLTTGSNLINSLDTAIKSLYDDIDERYNTEYVMRILILNKDGI